MTGAEGIEILRFCRAYTDAMANMPIRFSDFRVLTQICREQGVHTPANLARELKVSRAMISANLSALAAKGLILRVMSPDDGRSVMLVPTRQGIQMFRQINKNAQVVIDKLKSNMGQKKFDTLMRLIESANLIMGNNQMK